MELVFHDGHRKDGNTSKQLFSGRILKLNQGRGPTCPSPSRHGALAQLESSPDCFIFLIVSGDVQPHAVSSGQNDDLSHPDWSALLCRSHWDLSLNPLLSKFRGSSYQRHRPATALLPSEDHLGVDEEEGAFRAAAVDVDGVVTEGEGARLTGNIFLPSITVQGCKTLKK